jgi:DNA-binding NtrC family response regulator
MASVPSSLQAPKASSSDDDLAKSVILTPADLARIQAAEVEGFGDGSGGHPFEEALAADTFQDFKDRAERLYIEERLREYNWNISRTAEAMNIQRSHLYTKMRKFGLMKDKAGGEEVEVEETE